MLKDMRLSLSGIAAAVLAFLVLLPAGVMAQTPPPPASSQEPLKPEELEALVAPIALYPDALLAEVLMAATYPLEVVQADRWLTANKNLKEDQLKAAVDKQPWDDSVKSLAATPSVLTMMGSKLDWTQKLGDAFLAQQTDVMDAIQRLRTGRSLQLSRPTPIRSMCRITILLLSMANGRTQIIRRTIFQTLTRVTSDPDFLPRESHSVPDMPSAAGRREETTGVAGSIGIETQST